MEYRFNENNFADEVMKSDLPVMIDFYAEWCGPCRMMSPVVSQFAKDYDGRVKIGKINVDEESGLAARFGVQSIPSFVFIKDGRVVDMITGAMPKPVLRNYLEDLAAG
ncbi:thioredoxin [Butyrivibrio sp. AE2032]|uniref:thioredoxin n=1 Tax=Butyrivibrio sp. AE2032 TaxID=1458463 RepID=UPI000550E89A|nr:thioredoxin [Butyrivibrio sp. AE2032]